MAYLLDTHAYWWFIHDDDSLSKRARNLIENSDAAIFVSVASCWELVIKHGIGKIKTDLTIEEYTRTQLALNDFRPLPILPAHLVAYAKLPFHHRDPFDRLLIAQAMAEKFTIITIDQSFSKYRVKRLW